MVCGIGINDMPRGWSKKNKWNYLVYRKWHDMLQRCYSKKLQERKPTYKGCFVCERWLILSNFVEDFPKINGYDEEKFLNGELSLDKDIKSDNQNKCYTLEQCLLVVNSENIKQAMKHRDYIVTEEHKQKISENHADVSGKNNPKAKKIIQYDKQGNLIKVWEYIGAASEELGINQSSISHCCRGKRKSAGGYVWRYVNK